VISPNATAEVARHSMLEAGISALPVVDTDGSLQGIVTSTDLLRWPAGDQRVASIMSDHVYTLPPYAEVHVCARLMTTYGIHHVVVSVDQQVVGIVASYDLLAFVEQYSQVRQGKAPTRRARAKKSKSPPKAESQRDRLNALLGHLSRRNAAVDRDRKREPGMEADFAEQAVVRENDEVLDALASQGRHQIDQVGRALDRLDADEYGTCEDCNQPIVGARLVALPFATTCIDCAREREASQL